MRKTVFLLASLFVMACGIQSVKAQTASASASASAKATIITPIAITHEGKPDLNFGNIVAGTATGTVTVDTEGNRTSSTGITLPNATPGDFHAAEFTVTGLANATYAITLPDDNTVTISGPGEDMTVTGFTSNPDGTGVLAGGTQTLSVGATLNVGANQPAGTYEGSFSVTVAYN